MGKCMNNGLPFVKNATDSMKLPARHAAAM